MVDGGGVDDSPSDDSGRPSSDNDDVHTVRFRNTGETVSVRETETILRACLEAGIAQEYSCRVGMCLACSARIVEGEVTQPAARGLTDRESEEYALTCMARPQSDLVLERGVYPPSIESPAREAGGEERLSNSLSADD